MIEEFAEVNMLPEADEVVGAPTIKRDLDPVRSLRHRVRRTTLVQRIQA